MIELRWLETPATPDPHCAPAAIPFLKPVRTLQYRNASEIISQDRSIGSATWTAGTDWQDVPVVQVSGGEIAAARAANEDTTGLCTVREWAEMLFNTRGDVSRWNPLGVEDHPLSAYRGQGGMSFTHNGKRYNVEMVVTKVGPL